MKSRVFFVGISIFAVYSCEKPFVHRGPVLDEVTANKIAETEAIKEYGEKQIKEEQPFSANLAGDVWVVKGSYPNANGHTVKGGVVEVKISKADGHIVRMIHGE